MSAPFAYNLRDGGGHTHLLHAPHVLSLSTLALEGVHTTIHHIHGHSGRGCGKRTIHKIFCAFSLESQQCAIHERVWRDPPTKRGVRKHTHCLQTNRTYAKTTPTAYIPPAPSIQHRHTHLTSISTNVKPCIDPATTHTSKWRLATHTNAYLSSNPISDLPILSQNGRKLRVAMSCVHVDTRSSRAIAY